MSAFLGPIHYWLYNKIKLQETLVENLLLEEEKKLGALASLRQEIYEKYGMPRTESLESIINANNIHGWLQDCIGNVEYKLSESVTQLIGKHILSLEEIEAVARMSGKTSFEAWGKESSTPEQVYQAIFDHLLEGMPCDRINEVIECNENYVIWHKTRCIHQNYWEAVDGNVDHYNHLKLAWINGFLENTPMHYQVQCDGNEVIRKGQQMDGIEIMKQEHRYIEDLLEVMRTACYKILQGEEIAYSDFEKMIDFVRNYADVHHHGKEEKFLFNEMITHIHGIGEKLIKGGMLVEHDLGRLYISELEEALTRCKAGDDKSKLDVIANAVGYTHLLKRHIAKEDEVVYTFALRSLPESVLNTFHEQCRVFEEDAVEKGTQSHYLALLNELQEKYPKAL